MFVRHGGATSSGGIVTPGTGPVANARTNARLPATSRATIPPQPVPHPRRAEQPLARQPVDRPDEERHRVDAAEVGDLDELLEVVLRVAEEVPPEPDHLVGADVLEEREPGREVGPGVF